LAKAKLVFVALLAVAGGVAIRRWRAARSEADLWHRVTTGPDPLR
jgi:hypothetical protein